MAESMVDFAIVFCYYVFIFWLSTQPFRLVVMMCDYERGVEDPAHELPRFSYGYLLPMM